MTLHLEYNCTEAEAKEAQSLHLRHQYGGGSKWRAQAFLYGTLALAGVALYFKFKTVIAPKDRVWFVALVAVVYFALLLFQRKTRRKKTEGLTRVEFSEQGVAFDDGVSRTVMLWSAFSRCLESPNLFVLLDRTKTVLYTVPKRAFPDEAAQAWFRSQATQPRSVPPAMGSAPFAPGQSGAADGITLRLQLKYRDYLSRYLTSWRIKGLVLAVFAIAIGTTVFTAAQPSPDAVNSPGKVLLIMAPMLGAMMVVMFFFVSFVSWRGEEKYLAPQQILVTGDGIEFMGRDSAGRLPWDTYKYYCENRWSFFVWQPQGSLWLMFPKREFASPSDLEKFRLLLQTNLKSSRWFYM